MGGECGFSPSHNVNPQSFQVVSEKVFKPKAKNNLLLCSVNAGQAAYGSTCRHTRHELAARNMPKLKSGQCSCLHGSLRFLN